MRDIYTEERQQRLQVEQAEIAWREFCDRPATTTERVTTWLMAICVIAVMFVGGR